MELDALVCLVVDRVADCYDKHGMCCSESVMVVFNRAFDGGVSDKSALQMGAGFCHGIGGAGCSCGALTGSVLMLSLFLGHHQEYGLAKKEFQGVARGMHDEFRKQFGSSCCRILSKKVCHDKKVHHGNCLMLTKGGAMIAVSLLLKLRPQLVNGCDVIFLESREHPFGD